MKILFFVLTMSAALWAGSANATGLKPTVDDFIAAIQAEVASTQPFFRFAKLVDPFSLHKSTTDTLVDILRNQYRNKDATFDVIYRNKDSEHAETIIGALWADKSYSFMAFVLHKRPDGWLPISYSLQSDYQKIMRFR